MLIVKAISEISGSDSVEEMYVYDTNDTEEKIFALLTNYGEEDGEESSDEEEKWRKFHTIDDHRFFAWNVKKTRSNIKKNRLRGTAKIFE